MTVINNIEHKLDGPAAVALGYFNGVHIGHRRVISAAVEAARELECAACVFTFEADAQALPVSKRGRPLLMTPQDKRSAIAALGVEVEYSPDFAAFAAMPPEVFFHEVLLGSMRAKAVLCGNDYRFGAGARGDAALLARLCRESGVRLTVVPPELYGGEAVSSTRIVAAAEAGDIPLANAMLGAPLSLSGAARVCAVPASHSACHCCGNAPHPAADDPDVKAFLRYKAAAAFSTVAIDAPPRFVRPACGVYRAEVDGQPTAAALYPVGDTLRWELAAQREGELRACLLELVKPMRDYDSPETLRAVMFSASYRG